MQVYERICDEYFKLFTDSNVRAFWHANHQQYWLAVCDAHLGARPEHLLDKFNVSQRLYRNSGRLLTDVLLDSILYPTSTDHTPKNWCHMRGKVCTKFVF